MLEPLASHPNSVAKTWIGSLDAWLNEHITEERRREAEREESFDYCYRAGGRKDSLSRRKLSRQFIERAYVALAATPRLDISYARGTESDGEAQHYG